jgi:UDP-N-acetylglucosamine--N-acetylmuramyl-(pentapeptide) pyrophosphoryl-undecaprenol N-acetylglucosamine transferase
VIAADRPPMGGPLFAFAGGGTGGHLYPAIAVLHSLRDRVPGGRFVFFATQRTIDGQILANLDCEVVPQPLSPLSPKPWRWPAIYQDFHAARYQSRQRFLSDSPAVILGTGGLASVPGIQEARRAGIPTAILNPDASPGRANRYLGRSANVIFAQWEDTVMRYPQRVEVRVVGCPVRPAFRQARAKDGIARFGLRPDRRTLLVTGASQGATSINEAIVALLAFLVTQSNWQILHLSGAKDFTALTRAYAAHGVAGKVVSYTEHMADALAAADLVISRAGASTLAELTAVGRAAILMPYPFHRDQHQLANAQCLERVGAARIVRDANNPAANARELQPVLAELMSDDGRRAAMSGAARRLGRLDAAEVIAEHLLQLAGCVATAARESVEVA